MTAWNKGIPMSEEKKKHLSELNKGKPSYVRTEKTKEKQRKARKNYVVSDETKKKLSESHMGNPGFWTGKKRSQETRAKLGTPVEMYDLNTDITIKWFVSMGEAGEWLKSNGYTNGVNPSSSIGAVCAKKKKSYAGFGWRHAIKK